MNCHTPEWVKKIREAAEDRELEKKLRYFARIKHVQINVYIVLYTTTTSGNGLQK